MAVNEPSYQAWGNTTDRQFQRNWERTQEKKAKKFTAEEQEQLDAQEILKHMVCDVEGHSWDFQTSLCTTCGVSYMDQFIDANFAGGYTSVTWTTTANQVTWANPAYYTFTWNPTSGQYSGTSGTTTNNTTA